MRPCRDGHSVVTPNTGAIGPRLTSWGPPGPRASKTQCRARPCAPKDPIDGQAVFTACGRQQDRRSIYAALCAMRIFITSAICSADNTPSTSASRLRDQFFQLLLQLFDLLDVSGLDFIDLLPLRCVDDFGEVGGQSATRLLAFHPGRRGRIIRLLWRLLSNGCRSSQGHEQGKGDQRRNRFP